MYSSCIWVRVRVRIRVRVRVRVRVRDNRRVLKSEAPNLYVIWLFNS